MNKLILDQGKDSYVSSLETLNEMFSIIKSVDKEFDDATQFRVFDCVLQACMLASSASQKRLTENECAFLNVMHAYVSLIDMLNLTFNDGGDESKNVSWELLAEVSEKTLEDFSLMAINFVIEHAKSLAELFAIIDKAVTAVDYLEKLNDYVLKTFISYAMISEGDDDSVTSQAQSAYACYNNLIVSVWETAMQN